MTSALLLAAATGFAAAWPIGAAGLLAGSLAERVTRDPAFRGRVWLAALLAPPVFLTGSTVALVVTPRLASAALRASASVSSSGQTAAWLAQPSVEILAGAIVALSLCGLALSVMRLCRGHALLCRLRQRSRSAELVAHGASVPVMWSEEIGQPVLAGLFRPVILLPATALELAAEQLRLIIAHEGAHHSRLDNVRLAVGELVVGLFWLTPILRIIRMRAAEAAEEASDARALLNAGPEDRRLYAETLVRMLRRGAGRELQTAFTGADRRPNAMRLKSILEPSRPARTSIAVLGAAIGAAGLFAMGAAAQETATQAATASLQKVGATTATGHAHKQGVVLIDGKPAPAGFDMNSIPAERIARIEVSDGRDGKPAGVNLVLKHPAG